MEKQIHLPYKLRNQLLSLFIVIIVLLATLNVGSLFWSGTYYKSLSNKLNQHVDIYQVSTELITIQEVLGNYISSGNKDYIQELYPYLTYIQQQIADLKASSRYRSTLYYQLHDVSNMVTTLKQQIDKLIGDYTAGRPMIYVRDQENTIHRHIGYIEGELFKVNSTYMESIQESYTGFSQTMGMVIRITLFVTLGLVLLSTFIARQFTLSISRPIHTLALTMLQFGRGNLDVAIEPIKNNGEISILINSFNSMSGRIRRLIHGIREKAEIEKQLKHQEYINQETQRLLRESELALLESQINPHFLFNTLNTISVIAQIEESPQTEQLILNLSTMLRYNLKNQNEMVKLGQELAVVRSYMHIQQTRYGDKISYIEDLDPETLDVLVPSMLLQPLIENAIKHGLEPLGRKGTVEMYIKRISDEYIQVTVRDDGKGIDQVVIDRLYSEKPSGNEKPLGLYNVLRRLELCYGEKPLSVQRRNPQGTECIINLPIHINEFFDDIPVESAL